MFVSKNKFKDQENLTAFYQQLLQQERATLSKEFGLNHKLKLALREILAQKTDGANATVTRMAKIAAEALGQA